MIPLDEGSSRLRVYEYETLNPDLSGNIFQRPQYIVIASRNLCRKNHLLFDLFP